MKTECECTGTVFNDEGECLACLEWNNKIKAEVAADLKDRPKCEECSEPLNKEQEYCGICSDCCDHSDMDGGCCLICGADRMEDMMAMAYDRAKDARKYGDT